MTNRERLLPGVAEVITTLGLKCRLAGNVFSRVENDRMHKIITEHWIGVEWERFGELEWQSTLPHCAALLDSLGVMLHVFVNALRNANSSYRLTLRSVSRRQTSPAREKHCACHAPRGTRIKPTQVWRFMGTAARRLRLRALGTSRGAVSPNQITIEMHTIPTRDKEGGR